MFTTTRRKRISDMKHNGVPTTRRAHARWPGRHATRDGMCLIPARTLSLLGSLILISACILSSQNFKLANSTNRILLAVVPRFRFLMMLKNTANQLIRDGAGQALHVVRTVGQYPWTTLFLAVDSNGSTPIEARPCAVALSGHSVRLWMP